MLKLLVFLFLKCTWCLTLDLWTSGKFMWTLCQSWCRNVCVMSSFFFRFSSISKIRSVQFLCVVQAMCRTATNLLWLDRTTTGPSTTVAGSRPSWAPMVVLCVRQWHSNINLFHFASTIKIQNKLSLYITAIDQVIIYYCHWSSHLLHFFHLSVKRVASST